MADRGLSPRVSGAVDLGSASRLWRKLYLTLTGKAELGIGYHRRARKAFTLADLEAAVASGKYNEYDIEPGDYYVGTSGYTYIFAGDNPLKGTNPYTITVAHAGLVVDTHESCEWNDTDDTTGGYISSNLHNFLVNTVLPNVKSDLGVDHLISHYKQYSNSVNTTTTSNRQGGKYVGASNGMAWSSGQYISALTEPQVVGGIVTGSSLYDVGEGYKQLEVFRRYTIQDIIQGHIYLRSITSAQRVTYAYTFGPIGDIEAANGGLAVGLVAFH